MKAGSIMIKDKENEMWVPLRDLREQPFKCRDLPIEAQIETNPKMLLSILKADLAYYYYKITGKRID